MKTYTHPTLWRKAIYDPHNEWTIYNHYVVEEIKHLLNEKEVISLWFIEDKQEDWIEKICYELEPDLNIWYDYLIDQEKLLSRNETANISRDRIRQAILKHLPK